MKLIENWRKAYRMISVQSMSIAAAIQTTWLMTPEDMRASVPISVVFGLTIGLMVFGVIGRLIDQPKVRE